MNQPIFLAYSIENLAFAEKLESKLSKTGYKFEHIYATEDSSLNEQMELANGPILLIVSDNLLKSTNSMRDTLTLVQDKNDQILPIVIDGTGKGEEGEIIAVPTKYDRVSDVIKYINYWQDKYLDFRKQKYENKDLDQESFNAYLSILREIASEIGEVVRLLREMDGLSYEQLKNEDFQAFFEFLDLPEDWEKFQGKPTKPKTVAEKPDPETVEEAVEQLTGSEKESTPSPTEEEPTREEGSLQEIQEEQNILEEEIEIPSTEADTDSDNINKKQEIQEGKLPKEDDTLKAKSIKKKKKKKATEKSGSRQGLAEVFYQQAMMHLEAQDSQKDALKALKNTVKLIPEHPFAHYDMALIYHQQKKLKKARKAYLKAIDVNAEFQTPENDLAFGLLKPKNTKKATSLKMQKLEKKSIGLKRKLAKLKKKLAEKEAEIIEMELALEAEKAGNEQTVLISGATSGIGRATAVAFAEHGFKLILTGRRKERLEELASFLENQFEAEVLTLCFDIRDNKAVKKAIQSLDESWQNIDILINNAGKAKGLDPIHKGKIAHWDEMIDTNVKGLLYLTRLVTPKMVKRGRGIVINTGSTSGKELYPKGAVYCATKFAVDALTIGMRLDLHHHGIKVGQVLPGHVEQTEFASVRFDGDSEKAKIYEDFNPLTSDDVAEAILFMASRPAHVTIHDIQLAGTQQASNLIVNRSGRIFDEEEE